MPIANLPSGTSLAGSSRQSVYGGAPAEEFLFLIVLLLAVAAFCLGCFLEKRAERKDSLSSSIRINKPPAGEGIVENSPESDA